MLYPCEQDAALLITFPGVVRRAGTKDARCAYDAFVARYSPKHSKAVTCLTKNQDVLFTFYSVPR